MTRYLTGTLTLTHQILSRMALFVWGFIWLFMSVLIFFAGHILPQLRSKPPPLALIPSPRSPRVRSAPVTPAQPPLEPAAPDPDEAETYEPAVSAPAPAPTVAGPSTTKKPAPRKKWSLPTRFSFGRTAPSPKSSLLSDGSATLVGSPSPPRFFPELPLVESASPSSDPGCSFSRPGSAHSTPASTPRTGRSIQLPGAKAFKLLSRRISVKKSDALRNRSHSPRASVDVLPLQEEASFYYEEADADRMHRTSTAEAHKPTRPVHLLHQRGVSLPGEVFTTSFVNPFRSRARKSKGPPALDLSEPAPSPAPPKRPFTPRRVLTSFQLALTSSTTTSTRSHSYSHSKCKSRRSSVSSSSTAVSASSAPSALALSGVDAPPRSAPVPRTQPYAAPYFAAMPRSSRPASRPDPSPKPREREREGRKRAASLSPPLQPETVAEEIAEEPHPPPAEEEGALSALELGLGQLGHGRPRRQQRESRQRVAVSESAILLRAER
ncbi:hypothetical protein C2E23DRAFT_392807 [Lenzites betulinus]|nr:hypothetical protein C2E23DRAFT_392807 [Lenzites betulinus]